MRNASTGCWVRNAKGNAERRVGTVALKGRYHNLPKRLEDDFLLGKELGSGFNGSVYSAKCRHTGIRHAIKKLSLHGHDAATKQQLAGELSVSLSLDHPHVARLHHVYEAEGTVSLVMECLSGGELFDRVREKKVFEESNAKTCISQMLLAVGYLHHEGVTHRDLKLENFIYDEPGSDYIKLIDFGFSKYSNGNKMNEALGTLPYAAPEVLRRSYSGGSCDMWSLGCIAFILLFGHMPFDASNDSDLANQILRGSYKKRARRWQAVSRCARDFVTRLLLLNPADRMTAAQALAHPLLATGLGGENSGLTSCARAFISLSLADDFTKATLQVMAWSLTLDERRKLRSKFDNYFETGVSQGGVIEIRDLEDQFNELGIEPSWRSYVTGRLHALDVQGRGELHYSDWLAAMMARTLEQGDEADEMLRATFRSFDEQGDGYISTDSLTGMVSITDGVRKAFEQESLAVSGRMNVEEFIAYLYEHHEAISEMLSNGRLPPIPETAREVVDSEPRWKHALSKLVPSCLSLPKHGNLARAGADRKSVV